MLFSNLEDSLTVICVTDMKLGRNLARSFLDYYKLTGYISSKPSSGLVPRVSRGVGTKDRDRERDIRERDWWCSREKRTPSHQDSHWMDR